MTLRLRWTVVNVKYQFCFFLLIHKGTTRFSSHKWYVKKWSFGRKVRATIFWAFLYFSSCLISLLLWSILTHTLFPAKNFIQEQDDQQWTLGSRLCDIFPLIFRASNCTCLWASFLCRLIEWEQVLQKQHSAFFYTSLTTHTSSYDNNNGQACCLKTIFVFSLFNRFIIETNEQNVMATSKKRT